MSHSKLIAFLKQYAGEIAIWYAMSEEKKNNQELLKAYSSDLFDAIVSASISCPKIDKITPNSVAGIIANVGEVDDKFIYFCIMVRDDNTTCMFSYFRGKSYVTQFSSKHFQKLWDKYEQNGSSYNLAMLIGVDFVTKSMPLHRCTFTALDVSIASIIETVANLKISHPDYQDFITRMKNF